MTNLEFSNQFEVLYNNITSDQAPGLDNYEKSVFLTKAQDEIVKSYFDPRTNKPQEGFDGSEKRQIDFSMILRTKTYESSNFTAATFDIHPNTKKILLDTDIMMFINEFADVTRPNNAGTGTVRLTVIPLDYKEYSRLMYKPFKRPLLYQAWRILDNSNKKNSVEIIVGPDDTLTKYSIRYIKKPTPIVLGNIEGLSLEGKSTNTECELDPILHQEILQRAVELAKIAMEGTAASHIQGGNQSGTDKGYNIQQASR